MREHVNCSNKCFLYVTGAHTAFRSTWPGFFAWKLRALQRKMLRGIGLGPGSSISQRNWPGVTSSSLWNEMQHTLAYQEYVPRVAAWPVEHCTPRWSKVDMNPWLSTLERHSCNLNTRKRSQAYRFEFARVGQYTYSSLYRGRIGWRSTPGGA